jgi:YggT family protein
MLQGVMTLLGTITSVYMIVIFIRILLTWFSGVRYGKVYDVLCGITDPYLEWFRRFRFLRIASLDLSPLAALAILSVVNEIFMTLGRYGRITVGIILYMLLSAVWSVASFLLVFFIIILTIRLIAYLTNRNVYSGFWRIIDMLSQPVLYRINRILFRKRLVHYMTGILSSLGALLALRLGLGLLVRLVMRTLTQLPF